MLGDADTDREFDPCGERGYVRFGVGDCIGNTREIIGTEDAEGSPTFLVSCDLSYLGTWAIVRVWRAR